MREFSQLRPRSGERTLGGKRIVSVERTDETVSGPSRLYKMVLGEDGDGQADDELTVTFGCRDTSFCHIR